MRDLRGLVLIEKITGTQNLGHLCGVNGIVGALLTFGF